MQYSKCRNTRWRAIWDPAAHVSTQGQGWSKHLPHIETRGGGGYGTCPSHVSSEGGTGEGSENIPPIKTRDGEYSNPLSRISSERGEQGDDGRAERPLRLVFGVRVQGGPSCILKAGGGQNTSRRVDGG